MQRSIGVFLASVMLAFGVTMLCTVADGLPIVVPVSTLP